MKINLARLTLPAMLFCAVAFAQAGAAAPAAAAPAATSAPAPSAPAATPKIGIINIQQAILLTNEGKRDVDALDKKFDPKRTELQGLNKEIESLQTQLRTQGDKLNDDTRKKMVGEVESKQKTLQRSLEDAQGEYQNQQNELVNRIGGKLMQVLDTYAKNNGYTLILDYSQGGVLWAGQTVDVTQQVVEAYNTQSGVAAPANASSAPAAPSALRAPSATRPAAQKTPGTTGAPGTTPK